MKEEFIGHLGERLSFGNNSLGLWEAQFQVLRISKCYSSTRGRTPIF